MKSPGHQNGLLYNHFDVRDSIFPRFLNSLVSEFPLRPVFPCFLLAGIYNWGEFWSRILRNLPWCVNWETVIHRRGISHFNVTKSPVFIQFFRRGEKSAQLKRGKNKGTLKRGCVQIRKCGDSPPIWDALFCAKSFGNICKITLLGAHFFGIPFRTHPICNTTHFGDRERGHAKEFSSYIRILLGTTQN